MLNLHIFIQMKRKKDTKIEINAEFKQALDLLENSSKTAFITGKAGTGKSTLLKYFRKTTKKKAVVLAPTGVSALNVEGQTIHSFFLIPPNITPEKVLEHKLTKKRQKLIMELDMIIIDEVSMLRADLLDCIDVSLRHYRKEPNLAFGGVQMIFIGDLYQLPPVVTREDGDVLVAGGYKSPYFFSAKVLREGEIIFINFEKIYRQKDNDFIELLNKIRDNSAQDEDLEMLNIRFLPAHELEEISSGDDFVITLTTTNREAKEKNLRELKKLHGKKQHFFGEAEGEFARRSLPTEKELVLKEGAQVMLLHNDSMGRYVNGSLGKVLEIKFDDVELEDIFLIELETGKKVEIKRHSWNIYKYFFNEDTQKIDTKIAGSFHQFPLRLAWAVTIHKSQGKTFEQVIVDIGRGTFAHGQLYVALSRCTSLEGIFLKKPILKRHVLVDKRIGLFFKYFQQVRENGYIDTNDRPAKKPVAQAS